MTSTFVSRRKPESGRFKLKKDGRKNLETIFGVVHGDLFYHHVFGGKIIDAFVHICRVAPSDMNGKRGVVL